MTVLGARQSTGCPKRQRQPPSGYGREAEYSDRRVATREGEIDMGIEENKSVARQYLTGMHAAPPDLKVFDELLAANYQGDRAGQEAFASALHAAVGEQIFEWTW